MSSTAVRAHRRLLTPWGAAGWLYGRYGLPHGDWSVPGVGDLSRLGPVVGAVFVARACLTFNVVALIVQSVEGGVDDVVASVVQGGAVTMVVGPFGVLLAVGGLVAMARGTRRWTALRQLARPVLVALVTFVVSVGIFGLQLPGVRQAVQALIDPVAEAATRFPFALFTGFMGVWLFIFGLCAVYLIHRNAFSGTGGAHLLDPLVSIWLAWTVAAVQISMYHSDGMPSSTFTTLTIASATIATMISIGMLIVLHRRGITFRSGPWAS